MRVLGFTDTRAVAANARPRAYRGALYTVLEKFGDHKERFMTTIGPLSGSRTKLEFSLW